MFLNNYYYQSKNHHTMLATKIYFKLITRGLCFVFETTSIFFYFWTNIYLNKKIKKHRLFLAIAIQFNSPLLLWTCGIEVVDDFL